MSILCPLDGKECWSSGCFFQHGQNKICTKQNFTIATDRTVMTEPIDQTTKGIIREEARKFASFLTAPNELEKFHHIHTGYVKGATVWAEKLKQERNKVIDEFYNLMDKELQTEPINRARYMNRLFEFKESLKDKSHE